MHSPRWSVVLDARTCWAYSISSLSSGTYRPGGPRMHAPTVQRVVLLVNDPPPDEHWVESPWEADCSPCVRAATGTRAWVKEQV